MKNKSSIDEVKKAVEALEEVCERVGVNYAVFFSEQPHSITGGATFTIEEYAILIETFSRRLPLEQVRFLRKVMDMIITDRSSSSWPVFVLRKNCMSCFTDFRLYRQGILEM